MTAPLHRLIVKFANVLDEEELRERAESLVAEVPGAVLERVSRSGRVLLDCPEWMDLTEASARLSQRPDVVYAEPDVTDRAQPETQPGTQPGTQPDA